MSNALEILKPNFKVKLSVPLIAAYLKQGKKQTDIATACNVSDQAVSDYIKRHNDKLLPLVEPTDTYLATKSLHVANMAMDNLSKLLDSPPNKKELIALNAISGTHTDKYLTLSGKPTEITENRELSVQLKADLEAKSQRIEELRTKLLNINNPDTSSE